MGARKKISAEKRKEALKTMYFAKLQNVPTSPRKMRLVADMIRGMEVNRALGVLKFFFLLPLLFITLLFQINPVIFSCYQRVL